MGTESNESMTVTPDRIASLVQAQFDALPAKRKPAVRSNGVHEWVPLSGIVAEGMKCLPQSKLPQAQGGVLHDWHAEVLAIRAFNRFVLEECRRLLRTGEDSCLFLQRRTVEEMMMTTVSSPGKDTAGDEGGSWHAQPFAWRPDVALHMYCSEAPCGDASMELTMAAQADAAPWAAPTEIEADATTLPGRAYFSRLGAVRRKPARGDAPPTLSKSCSDKLALRQCTSLLSSLAALLVSPEHAYLRTVVLPRSQRSAVGCRRAFSSEAEGRMRPLARRAWGGGYAFRPFAVRATDVEFAFSRRAVAERVSTGGGKAAAASNLAVAWTARLATNEREAEGIALEETTLGGVVQGRKPLDPRSASFASRRRMWELAVEVARETETAASVYTIQRALVEDPGRGLDAISAEDAEEKTRRKTYGEVKDSWLLTPRRRAKEVARSEALRGWVSNIGDRKFSLF